MTLKPKLIYVIFLMLLFAQEKLTSQSILSESWQKEICHLDDLGDFDRNVIKTDASGNVYVLSNNSNINNKDIQVQKYSGGGILLWEHILNGSADSDDFAGDLYVDTNEDVFVTGASIDTFSNLFDLIV